MEENILGLVTSLSRPLRSKNDAKVSWNALMTQDVSPAVIFRSSWIRGRAENRELKLNASRNWTKQKTTRRKYFLALEKVSGCFSDMGTQDTGRGGATEACNRT